MSITDPLQTTTQAEPELTHEIERLNAKLAAVRERIGRPRGGELRFGPAGPPTCHPREGSLSLSSSLRAAG